MSYKAPLRVVRRPELRLKTGISDSRRDELERAGQFPKRIRLGDRACGWIESEVDEWIATRPRADDVRPDLAGDPRRKTNTLKSTRTAPSFAARGRASSRPEEGERDKADRNTTYLRRTQAVSEIAAPAPFQRGTTDHPPGGQHREATDDSREAIDDRRQS